MISNFSPHRVHPRSYSFLTELSEHQAEETGLPRIAIPVSKLESGAQVPAFELAGAKRRTGRTLAARSFLGPADDSRAKSAAGQYCNAGASARSGPGPRGAS